MRPDDVSETRNDGMDSSATSNSHERGNNANQAIDAFLFDRVEVAGCVGCLFVVWVGGGGGGYLASYLFEIGMII